MTSYRPFLDEPSQIALLEGQRYVVLRPNGAVVDVFDEVRASVKDYLTTVHHEAPKNTKDTKPCYPVSFAGHPHVTLAGFPKGTSLESVRALVAEWASTMSRLQLEVERVSVFPSPFQIVIVQVRKTPELFDAKASLRERARQRGFGDVLTTPPADWIFHMSVAYCSSLDAPAWADLIDLVEIMHVPAASCSVREAEVVAFDGGREYSGGVFAL